MASIDQENNGGSCFGHWFNTNIRSRTADIAGQVKKLVQDDRRKIIHPLKVGLAITVVSLLYYFQTLYDGFGNAAMWAVLTVVVVFDFSVGATLGRGLLRGLGTFIGGSLGVISHRLATFSGRTGEPIILGIFGFGLAAVVTFVRLFPMMKSRYDYGLVIVILTFSLVSVSSYRDDQVLEMAHERLSTVLIGGAAAVAVCVFICPAWAGEDLHSFVAINMEKLAVFLEGFGQEYFKASEQSNGHATSLQGYKSVLDSKSIEDSLVNFAKWEPPHGGFRYQHPWEQYLTIGALTRECANLIDSLNRHLISSEIQTSVEIREKVEDSCKTISSESSCALKELALTMKTMTTTRLSSADSHLSNSKTAAENLKSQLETWSWPPPQGQLHLLEIIPVASVGMLLIEIVGCNVKIAEAVGQLANLAHFNTPGTAAAAVAPEPAQVAAHDHIIMVPGSPPE